MNVRFVPLAAIILAWTSAAWADAASDAKAHYERATAHFAVGEFAKAADEYQEAYELKPDPALLYNAAQSFRLAGNNEKALILYKNYVQLYPDQPNVDGVRDQIAKLKDAIAAQEKAKSNPPTSTVPVPPSPATAPPLAATTPIHRDRPLYKRWWLWTIVGGVVVAGAITAAVLATSTKGSWSQLPDVGPGAHALVQW